MRMLALTGALLALSGTAVASPFRYAEDRAPAIVSPLFTTTMSEARLNELVFEGLFTDDLDLRSTPRLAESWHVADDHMSMTIDLRRDVLWQDGQPLTAADVVFTIQAYQSRETASTESGRVAFIESAEAQGDYTVVLGFSKPEFQPEDNLHFKILPAHRFDGPDIKRTHRFRSTPIGTGPWRVVGFNDDNAITMVRHKDYYGEAGMSEVTMREVADKNYQAKLLIYESLEALVQVLPRDLAALQNDRKVELYPYQTNSWWYVGYNLRDERFKDQRVREALSCFVDTERLLAPVGTGEIVTGPFVKSSPYYNHDVPAQKLDEDRGKALLQEAGYTLTGRQWTLDGQPLKVRLATIENLETAQDVVIQLQAQLQNAGISVETEFLGSAEWKQRVWRDHDFDLILSQWTFDRNEDIWEQFHSSGARNFVGYSNPEVDAKLDESRLVTDPQQKKALLRQVHAAVAADDPMIFLWTLDSYSAMSVKVKNVVVHPFYFFTWARDWQLD